MKKEHENENEKEVTKHPLIKEVGKMALLGAGLVGGAVLMSYIIAREFGLDFECSGDRKTRGW